MTDRIKLLTQKRTSLKTQITSLTNALDKGKLDNATAKLRIARLTELYHKFEEHNDELAVLDPDDGHLNEFVNIQERFYAIAGRIECIISEASTSAESSAINERSREDNAESRSVIKKRRVKLPEASLPTFDGNYESWLSFKNAFINMIGSQSDLSDADKLYYLKSALTGEAANKIKIFFVTVTRVTISASFQ